MTRDHAIRVAVSGIKDPAKRAGMILRLLEQPDLLQEAVHKRLRAMRSAACLRAAGIYNDSRSQ